MMMIISLNCCYDDDDEDEDDNDDDDDLLGLLLSLWPNFCSAQEAAGFPPKVLDSAP